ncbi:MAG: hypothetical protein PVG03_14835 [Desulfarculaceae bacterium]|jgi:hypothetical protein
MTKLVTREEIHMLLQGIDPHPRPETSRESAVSAVEDSVSALLSKYHQGSGGLEPASVSARLMQPLWTLESGQVFLANFRRRGTKRYVSRLIKACSRKREA